MHNGIPYSVQIVDKETDAEIFASAIEAPGGKMEKLAKKRIIHHYAKGKIDYETAVFAIEKGFRIK